MSTSFFRSNYFRVKDPAAFKTMVGRFRDAESGVPIHLKTDRDGRYGFSGDFEVPDLAHGEDGEAHEIYFPEEIGKHLREGEICVLFEAATDGGWFAGRATAFNAAGEEVCLDWNDIYDLAAAKFGARLTRAGQ